MTQPDLIDMHALLAGAHLQKLGAKTAKLQAWQQLLEAGLEDALKPHCKVADFSAGILTLVVDSAAFATRLRYCQHSLIEILKKTDDFNKLYKIKGLISPLNTPVCTPSVDRRLSQTSADLLLDTAKSCENKKLKEVLVRLAAYTK